MREERATVRCSECSEGLISLACDVPTGVTGCCTVCGVVLRMRSGTSTIERPLVRQGRSV